jgi:hypothetical protein
MRNRFLSLKQIIRIGLIISLVSVPAMAQLIEDVRIGLYDDYLLNENNSDNYTGGYYVNSQADSLKWQSPTVALFKSLLIPGWGQLSNRQYIKAGIAVGLETTLIGAVIHHARKASDAKKAYENPPDTAVATAFLLYKRYDDAREKRNLYSWFAGAAIFWSMFDAYVDAHLAKFPKYNQGLSIQIAPGEYEDIRAVLALKF